MNEAPLRHNIDENLMGLIAADLDYEIVKTFNNDSLLVVIAKAKRALPKVVADIRREVYVDEWKILAEQDIEVSNDLGGIHVLIYDKSTMDLIACTHMVEARLSDFVTQSGLEAEDLSQAILSSRSTIKKAFRSKGLFPILIYAAGQHYRIRGYKHILAYIEEGDHPTQRRFNMEELPHADSRKVMIPSGKQFTLKPYVTTIEYAMYKCTSDLASEYTSLVSSMVQDEISETVYRWASAVNEAAVWRRARDMTLSKTQYCEFLGQLHQFVRYTTRVLALAMSRSEAKTLQKHFRKHLMEELDHETIIEADLKYLGVDVEYLVKHKATNPYICNFNALQESLLANRVDPIMYMAVPFAVEGISAFISSENLDALEACVATWGVKDAANGTRFLSSHRNFDGKDGGHWEMTQDMINTFVTTEKQGKQFLSIARATINNMLGMIDDVVGTADYVHWRRSETNADLNAPELSFQDSSRSPLRM